MPLSNNGRLAWLAIRVSHSEESPGTSIKMPSYLRFHSYKASNNPRCRIGLFYTKTIEAFQFGVFPTTTASILPGRESFTLSTNFYLSVKLQPPIGISIPQMAQSFCENGKKNLYKYTPSLPVAIIFTSIFVGLAVAHLFRMIRSKQWFMTAFIVGGVCMSLTCVSFYRR